MTQALVDTLVRKTFEQMDKNKNTKKAATLRKTLMNGSKSGLLKKLMV